MKTKWLILQVHCGQLQQCMTKNWYGLHVMLVRWCIRHLQIAQLQQKRSSTNSVNFHIYILVSLPSKQISQWSWAQALRQWHFVTLHSTKPGELLIVFCGLYISLLAQKLLQWRKLPNAKRLWSQESTVQWSNTAVLAWAQGHCRLQKTLPRMFAF